MKKIQLKMWTFFVFCRIRFIFWCRIGLMRIIKNFWKQQNTLERKLFWSILVVVTLASTGSAIFTVAEGMSTIAAACGFGCVLVCLMVAAVAVKTSLYNQCYLVMCCLLTCFLMPLLFLFCGGITSGMPLYYVTAIALIAYAARGTAKIVAFSVSVLVNAIVFLASWVYPNLVVAELDRDGAYLDILVTSLFTSLTLFAVGAFSLRAYAEERKKCEVLLYKLDYLSQRDPLTEIYNRRHLISHLQDVVWRRRNEFYLLMLDLDDFKRINDRLGHPFGDQIINAVARILANHQDEGCGECVARYGGVNFVYAMNASSEGEAFARAEAIRKEVRQLQFEDFPDVSVTISGGFVPCSGRSFSDIRQVLSHVDELLVFAKTHGKNQIRNGAD